MKKTNWVKIGERSYLPFTFSLNGSQNSKKYLTLYGDFNIEDKALMYQNRFYWPENEISVIADYQIKEYRKQGAKYLWSMAEKCERSGENFLKRIQELVSDKLSAEKEITDNFIEIIEEYRKFVVFMTLPWVLDNFLGGELNNILTKRNLKERVEIEKKLNQPLKLNEGELEQISLFKIASKMKSPDDTNKDILKEIQIHLDEYAWLSLRWLIGKPLTVDDIISRLKEIFAHNPREKLEELNDQPKKIKQEFEQIIRDLNLTNEEKELVLLIKEYVFIRTYRSDMINKTLFMIIPILKEVAKELNMTYDDLLFLSYVEIINCLNNPEVLKKINISLRKKSWLIYRYGEKITVLEGSEAIKFAKEQGVAEETHIKVNEVKGTTGYKGITSGKVRIVSNPNEISKVQKGDILVAVMTFPSYIMAMEKAAAFVTDEGGVLCHAAIVAREMKKPCVIATKIATKVFKDGDLVEVDANSGVVKLLERAKVSRSKI